MHVYHVYMVENLDQNIFELFLLLYYYEGSYIALAQGELSQTAFEINTSSLKLNNTGETYLGNAFLFLNV